MDRLGSSEALEYLESLDNSHRGRLLSGTKAGSWTGSGRVERGLLLSLTED